MKLSDFNKGAIVRYTHKGDGLIFGYGMLYQINGETLYGHRILLKEIASGDTVSAWGEHSNFELAYDNIVCKIMGEVLDEEV